MGVFIGDGADDISATSCSTRAENNTKSNTWGHQLLGADNNQITFKVKLKRNFSKIQLDGDGNGSSVRLEYSDLIQIFSKLVGREG